jgi:hypothetical protein
LKSLGFLGYGPNIVDDLALDSPGEGWHRQCNSCNDTAKRTHGDVDDSSDIFCENVVLKELCSLLET